MQYPESVLHTINDQLLGVYWDHILFPLETFFSSLGADEPDNSNSAECNSQPTGTQGKRITLSTQHPTEEFNGVKTKLSRHVVRWSTKGKTAETRETHLLDA
jgi:hypothetical protein